MSVSVPVVVLVRAMPDPARTELTVPDCPAKLEPVREPLPEMVPPEIVTVPAVWVVPPSASVPPLTVSAAEVAPSVPLPERVSVPLLTVVPPE